MDCCPLAKFEACSGNNYSFKYNVACRIIDRARKRYIRFQCNLVGILLEMEDLFMQNFTKI